MNTLLWIILGFVIYMIIKSNRGESSCGSRHKRDRSQTRQTGSKNTAYEEAETSYDKAQIDKLIARVNVLERLLLDRDFERRNTL